MTKLLSAKKIFSTTMSTFVTIMFLVITVLPLYYTTEAASCNKTSYPPANKPRVVLVHGFTGGAWNWFRIRFILESLGYSVKTLDFTASGQDLTDISKVETFEQYNEPLERFMASLPKNEKVVMVGHSAAGISLTKTLHHHAEKVHVAVYISATMLKYGYLTCEDLQIGVPGFSESKCNASCPKLPEPTCFNKTLMGPSVVPLITLTEGYSLRKLMQRPGPFRVIVTTNFTQDAKNSLADKVPRVYIKTSLDRALTPKMQDAMIKLWPPCEVIEINNDHDVPYEKPELISALIINATSYAYVD